MPITARQMTTAQERWDAMLPPSYWDASEPNPVQCSADDLELAARQARQAVEDCLQATERAQLDGEPADLETAQNEAAVAIESLLPIVDLKTVLTTLLHVHADEPALRAALVYVSAAIEVLP